MHTLPSEFFLNSVVIWVAIHIRTDFFSHQEVVEHDASDGNQIDQEEQLPHLVSDAPVHEQEGPVSSNLIDVGVFSKAAIHMSL